MIRSRTKLPLTLPLALTLVAVGCSPADAPDAAEVEATLEAVPAAPTRTVEIVSPANGSSIEGSEIRVVLQVDGMMIRPAGDTTANSGHHHLYLDAELTDPAVPVPTVPGSIIHMGDGSSEYVFTDVAPGLHRIIAVVADFAHFPLQPWVTDTIEVMVR